MFNKKYLKAAHKASAYNRTALNNDKKCGCFYCLEVFSPSEIKEWIPEQEDGDEVTALCPYCDVDSVLSESSGYPLTKDFLSEMQKYWF